MKWRLCYYFCDWNVLSPQYLDAQGVDIVEDAVFFLWGPRRRGVVP